MPDDLHMLAGAYALDALEPLERRRFEAHLAGCETCALDVRELEATASALAGAVAEPPPAALRARVLAEVAETRQDSPFSRSRRREVGGVGRLLLLSSVAVALLVVGTVAVLRSGSGDRIPSRDLAAIVADPQAAMIDLRDPTSRMMMRVVWSPSTQRAAVVAHDLPEPPAGHAYEMWAIGPDGAQPAGLLRPDEQGNLYATMDVDLQAGVTIAVTIEPVQGSEQPTTPVMASGEV